MVEKINDSIILNEIMETIKIAVYGAKYRRQYTYNFPKKDIWFHGNDRTRCQLGEPMD